MGAFLKIVNGWYLPDRDTFFTPDVLLEEGFQVKRLKEFLRFIPGRDNAWDVGAHIGTWTSYLAEEFKWVSAWEPNRENFAALKANLYEKKHYNVSTHNLVTWNENNKLMDMSLEGNTGMSYVLEDRGVIPTARLDSWAPIALDLIKVDVEGSEFPVLMGAEQLLNNLKPAIILENKAKNAIARGFDPNGATDFLKAKGYELAYKIKDDELWTC